MERNKVNFVVFFFLGIFWLKVFTFKKKNLYKSFITTTTISYQCLQINKSLFLLLFVIIIIIQLEYRLLYWNYHHAN